MSNKRIRLHDGGIKYTIGAKSCALYHMPNGTWLFESYRTIVGAVVGSNVYVTDTKYSTTTSRHVNIFHECLLGHIEGIPGAGKQVFTAYNPIKVSPAQLESMAIDAGF